MVIEYDSLEIIAIMAIISKVEGKFLEQCMEVNVNE